MSKDGIIKGCPVCNKTFKQDGYRYCPFCANALLRGEEWQRHLAEKKAADYANRVIEQLATFSEGYSLEDISIGGTKLVDILRGTIE